MEVRVANLRYIDTIFNGGSCCKPQVQILFLLEVVYTGESSLNLFYLIKYAGLQQGNNDVNVNSTIKSPLTLHKKKDSTDDAHTVHTLILGRRCRCRSRS